MRLTEVALAVATAIILFSCSGSSAGSGEKVRPLSIDEKARLKETVMSFSNVMSLAGNYIKLEKKPHALFAMLTGPATQPDSPIKKVIDESDCQKTIMYPDEFPPLKAGDNEMPQFTFDVSGPGCPVTYHAAVHGQQLPNGMTATIEFNYQALNDEAKQANDVDMSNLIGTITASQVQDQATQNVTVTMDMDFGGTGHSQKEGDFAMNQKIKLAMGIVIEQGKNGMGFSMNGGADEGTSFKFHDMTGEMTSHTSMMGQTQTADYKINGQTVTEAEYKELHDALNIPSMEQGQDQKQPGLTILSCTARVYPGTTAPADLQKDLDAGHLPAMPGLTEVTACSDMNPRAIRSEPLGAGQLQTSFNFEDPNFAKADIQYCEGTNCATAQRYYLPTETKGFAETLGNYTLVTFCEMKPSCF